MPRSLQTPLPPMALNTVDRDRPAPASSAAPCQPSSIALTAVVKDALIRHYGSLKAAAISLEYDLGQLSRDLSSGDFKLRRLELDQAAKAFVACALSEAYTVSPQARAQHTIRTLRSLLDELAQAVELIA